VAANVTWTPITDADQMIVHVITPKTVEEPAAAEAATVAAPAAATTEPEVIKKGKTEKEGDEKKEK